MGVDSLPVNENHPNVLKKRISIGILNQLTNRIYATDYYAKFKESH